MEHDVLCGRHGVCGHCPHRCLQLLWRCPRDVYGSLSTAVRVLQVKALPVSDGVHSTAVDVFRESAMYHGLYARG